MNWFKNLLGDPKVEHDVSLVDLEITSDPGTEWHPADKTISDLSYDEVMDHLAKPERLTQIDSGLVLDHDGDDEGTAP